MSETKQLPDGAFVPSHGRGFLRPAKRFEKGNKASVGNKSANGWGRVTKRKAAESLQRLWPALAEALKTPAPTRRAWWRKRQATILRALQGNQYATERKLLELMLLRTVPDRKIVSSENCVQCGLRLTGEALPIAVGPHVSGWAHVERCHTVAMQLIVRKARLELAKALEPWR